MLQFNRARSSGRAAHCGVAIAMPGGASGIWYAKDYNATYKAVPNTINSGTPLYTAASRSNGPAIAAGPITEWAYVGITDSTVSTTGPTGSTETVTRILAAGDWFVDGGALPTGTWTVSFDYKSNTGSSQTFKFEDFNNSGAATTLTATTSWQRATRTFSGGARVMLISPDRSTGIDMLVAYLSIAAGSSDPGRETLVGHAYFDAFKQSKVTNPATGVLDLSAAGSALIRFASDTTLTSGFTCGAMVKRTSSSNSGYMSILSKPENFNDFTAFIENGANTLKGQLGGTAPSASGMWDTNGTGWHIITHRYDGTNYDIFFDDVRVVHVAVSPTATLVRNLFLGAVNSLGSFSTSHQISSWFLYPTALTTVEIQTSVYPALKNQLIADGQSHVKGRLCCSEGDSIIADGNSFYAKSGPNLSPVSQGVNFAVSGSSLADVVSRWTSNGENTIIPSSSSGTYIMGMLIGANDLAGYTGGTDAIAAANYTAALFSHYDTMRAAGWKVVACTVLPKDAATAHNARRAIVNTNLRATVGVHIDALADFDTDAQMGIDASFSTYPANWTDGTHPNTTGHTRLEPIFRAAVNSL